MEEITIRGPGKYGPCAQALRNLTGGGIVLIVLDGDLGSGISIKVDERHMRVLPTLLRALAEQVDADLQQLAEPGQ